jgi:hypothetical protein
MGKSLLHEEEDVLITINQVEERKGRRTIDISQYRLLVGFLLLYMDRVPVELLDSAALL